MRDEKIKRKFRKIELETKARVQSTLQKLKFGNSGQKLLKIRYQSFLVFSNFAWSSYFLPILLSPIACRDKSLHITHTSKSPWIFKLFQGFHENINKMICWKVSNLKIFCKHDLACLIWVRNWYEKAFNCSWWRFLMDWSIFCQKRAIWIIGKWGNREIWIIIKQLNCKWEIFRQSVHKYRKTSGFQYQ